MESRLDAKYPNLVNNVNKLDHVAYSDLMRLLLVEPWFPVKETKLDFRAKLPHTQSKEKHYSNLFNSKGGSSLQANVTANHVKSAYDDEHATCSNAEN